MSSRRIPAWLKRALLPAWNKYYRAALEVGELVGAVRYRRFGRCIVCDRYGPWLYQRRVIPPRLEELWGLTPRLAEALARKESSRCAWCGAKLRSRRLASVLLEHYPVGNPPGPARPVSAWVRSRETRGLRIAEVNKIDGLHRQLQRLPHHAYSEYRPGVTPGFVDKDLRNEDLTKLTYSDASFDVVLTSETLEHVHDLSAALSEIRRVLVPGGRHIFTIPVLPGVPTTFTRARHRPGGAGVETLAPEIRHPGGDEGYLVFTEFGADFPDILRAAGFEVEIAFGPVREDDLAQVFICRKPL